MGTPAEHKIKRDQIVRVKQMVQAGGHFHAVPAKGFILDVFALAHFRVTVRETAAGHTDAQIRVGTK